MAAESVHALPSIGTRISHSGSLGIVRFVGAVHGTSGVWLGIEWDDLKRGKHDGVKDGKRYFACLVPNSGSFIRPTTAISYGVSFLTALTAKYIEIPHGGPSMERVILGSSGGAIEVEAIGLDKIRNNLARLERLRHVSLDNEKICKANPPGDIGRTCAVLRERLLTNLPLILIGEAVPEIGEAAPKIGEALQSRSSL